MHTLPQLLDRIGQFLRENPFPAAPRELYEPCDYILRLGGKRIRPALLLMARELFADNPSPALPTAAAIELFHNFTLMHDDIMDAAPLRRGHPTVHTKYDLNTGILSGDAMLICAYQFLAKSGRPETVAALLDVFNRTALEVCEGQQMDVNFESRHDVSIPEYLRMIELKTAVLLGAALQMGGICADAPAADAEHLCQFGRLAGIAFQIQDDLLDTFGDPATFGKQVGGDILQNKKTLLVLKTLEIAPDADRKSLAKWLKTNAIDNPEEKITAVRDIFLRNQIPALIRDEQARFQAEAFQHLASVNVPDARKTVLRQTIADLFVREN